SYTISGDDAGNYLAPVAETISAKIKPIDFSVTFENATAVYTASAQSIEVSGTLEGDVVLYSTDGTTYSVDVPEYTNVGEYRVYAKVQRANHNDWTGDAVLKITPATITAVGTAQNKTYDGNVTATTGVTFSGVLEEDEITVSVSGEFTDKAAAEGKTVNLEYVLGGAQAGNYVLSANATATANINKLQLTISGTSVADKDYDGTTAAAITLGDVDGVVGQDKVTVAASGAFPSAGVGTYDVAVSYTISGDDAGNYLAPVAETISAKIKPIDIDGLTFSGAENTYTAKAQSIEVTGTQSGDTILYSVDGENYSIDVPEYTNVGEYRVYAKVQRANYNDWTGSAVLKITPATIKAVGTAQNKTYDGNVTATTGVTFSGVLEEDVITVSVSGEFTDKAAAEGKTVNLQYVLGGAQAGNYVLSANETTTANIVKKAARVGVNVNDKVYDGTTTATVSSSGLLDIVRADDLELTINSIAFDDKNAGTNKTATATYTVTGDDANNYTFTADVRTATISKKEITANFTAASRDYNGGTSTTATFNGFAEGAVFSGDTVNVTVISAAFADKNVGTGKAVTVTFSTSGTDSSNYSVTADGSTTANINVKQLSVSGAAVDNKTYDRSTTATVTANGSLDGVETGDEVTIATATGTFADKNVGEN
ncbi:MAG: hypothetical protein IK105_09910, partial [Thermoguttaceae bacterium]|nr:hypothetical protein [Thermoguttaceae bacterium]